MSLSLYIHIPFCRHRCAYCDFNTYTSLGELKEAYATAVCAELAQVAGGEKRPFHTLFFGGGTPSLMSPQSIGQILRAVEANFTPVGAPEITMEANPGTVDEAYLAAVRAAGVNRISFGVQSAIPGELALLEREHDFATAVAAVGMARAVGLDNFSLDLIYGLPGQTLASWRESLLATLALDPPHLSLYCLTIEPGTPMQRWLHTGRINAPDPDLAADQYALACDLLGQHGYSHYEISNWAKPGAECAHNLTYWRDGEYLGLGAGAHGHAGGVRYAVVKQPRVYIRRLQGGEALATDIGLRGPGYPLSTAVADHHSISHAEAMSDAVITQLRLLQEGLDLAAFAARFGQTLAEAFPGVVDQLAGWGLVKEGENGRLFLTEKAYFLSNQVFYRFM
jgi:oxygen-independent coproporphyrinogen III oxidase